MNDVAPVRRFCCKKCHRVHPKWEARCPSCNNHEGLVMVDAPALEAPVPRLPVPVAVPVAETASIAPLILRPLEEPPPLIAPPRLSIVRAPSPDPDLEAPAEELRDAMTSSEPIPISDVPEEDLPRDSTGLAPLDAVLGGGLVVGSAVVLGSEPGAGKSTLTMQTLYGLGLRALYASGEESVPQCAARARRIGAASKKTLIVAETDVDVIIEHARRTRAQIVVVDSIQTAVCSKLGGGPGSPGQVRGATSRLVQFAKSTNTTLWIIGHVTNDGALSGPKTLKHLVDVVLELEVGARFDGNERILRCGAKNRFGAANVVGHFEMGPGGLAAADGDGWDEQL